MTISPPPLYDTVINDLAKMTPRWIDFIDSLYRGDAGDIWTPTFQNLTVSGTPVITGKYYRISDYLKYFTITITPGTNTSSTAGTTYCDNFPLTIANDGACLAVGGVVSVGAGIIDASTNRIYPPSWSGVTVPVTIIGIAEAQ